MYSEYNLGTPRAKYTIRRGDVHLHPNDMPELNDLRLDPAEMKNLAALAAYQSALPAWRQPAERT